MVLNPSHIFCKIYVKIKTFGLKDTCLSLFKPYIPRHSELLGENLNWNIASLNFGDEYPFFVVRIWGGEGMFILSYEGGEMYLALLLNLGGKTPKSLKI